MLNHYNFVKLRYNDLVCLVCLLQFWYLVIRCRGKWITGPYLGFCLLVEILKLARIFTDGCTVSFSGLGCLVEWGNFLVFLS